jgi:hypothetical protein
LGQPLLKSLVKALPEFKTIIRLKLGTASGAWKPFILASSLPVGWRTEDILAYKDAGLYFNQDSSKIQAEKVE